MPTLFLSYSTKDHFFAELADIKLSEDGIQLWRDHGQLRAGTDWRHGIEQGISECVAVLVALSSHSADSSYVTYEWAYALGKGKAVIPVKLSDCTIHPKLETIQYLDFTVPGALPWVSLVQRIREIEIEASPAKQTGRRTSTELNDTLAKQILAYLDQRGFQMASFDRFRKVINEKLSDDDFN